MQRATPAASMAPHTSVSSRSTAASTSEGEAAASTATLIASSSACASGTFMHSCWEQPCLDMIVWQEGSRGQAGQQFRFYTARDCVKHNVQAEGTVIAPRCGGMGVTRGDTAAAIRRGQHRK